MRKTKELLIVIVLLALAAPGCGACTGGPGSKVDLPATVENPGRDRLIDDDPFFGHGELPPWTVVIGEVDSTNHYAFAVGVGGRFVERPPGVRPCSGVLISPRLALTAGHCLCVRSATAPSPSAGVDVISPSTCAATAGVTAHLDGSDLPDEAGLGRSISYEGEVRPHPEMRILLDSEGAVISSEADLAVVRLPRPMELPIVPVEMATDEVRPGESMVVVGYPYHESTGSLGDERRYSREPITGVLGPDRTRIRFGSLDLANHKGDTGGPCLRDEGGAYSLLGISSRGLGREPTCTGTYAYRAWLEREIELAAGAPVIEREEPPAQGVEDP